MTNQEQSNKVNNLDNAALLQVAASRITALPQFWPSDPELWFARIEALFTIHAITRNETKFDYILAHASNELWLFVTVLIKEEFPGGESKYQRFKDRASKPFHHLRK